MDKQVQQVKPNYKKIYEDLLNKKYPEKIEFCKNFLDKQELSVLEVIQLNIIIFENSSDDSIRFNQKFRSYKKQDILKILDHQRKLKLNNTQVAKHFKVSRNTISKWRKMFISIMK